MNNIPMFSKLYNELYIIRNEILISHRYYKFIRYNEVKKCLIEGLLYRFLSLFSRYMNSCRKVTIAIWR